MYVNFSYPPAQGNLKASLQVLPTIDGLQGHAPACAVSSGNLPPGLSLNASSCTISGTPTAAGTYAAQITLSSAGVQGSVSAPATFDIVDPTPSIIKGSGFGLNGSGVPQILLQYGQPIGSPLVVAALDPASYTAQTGDVVTFAVTAGQLPGGVLLDPTNGTIQGTPTGVETVHLTIGATLVRGGIAYPTASSLTIDIQVLGFAFQITYLDQVCIAPVATAISCAPRFNSPSAVAGVTLTFSSNELPAGLVIDPQTGIISGAMSEIGFFAPDIQIQGVYPDGSSQRETVMAWVQAIQPFPVYNPVPSDFGLVSGPTLGQLATPYMGAQLSAGVPFGIDVSGVSGSEPGDVYTYALVPYDANTPVSSWVSIDPMTGHLSGTPPSGLTTAARTVQLTTLRAGNGYQGTVAWIVSF